MRYIFGNPANWSQTYVTGVANDPNVPAGYVLEGGSDGAPDRPQQQYVGGLNSGGPPPYTGDPSQLAAQPLWPNGLLSAARGNTR